MKAADMNNWSLNPEQFNDLAMSLNTFFAQTGLMAPDGTPQPGVSVAGAPFNMSQGSTSSAGTGRSLKVNSRLFKSEGYLSNTKCYCFKQRYW